MFTSSSTTQLYPLNMPVNIDPTNYMPRKEDLIWDGYTSIIELELIGLQKCCSQGLTAFVSVAIGADLD